MRKIALLAIGVGLIAGTAVLWPTSIQTGTPAQVASILVYELHHVSKHVSELPVHTFEDLI